VWTDQVSSSQDGFFEQRKRTLKVGEVLKKLPLC
jgi:hypothetical protein